MSHGLTVPIINPSTLSCSTSDNESVSVKKKDNIHGVVYSTNFENTLEGIEKYLVAPTAILSGASSVLSFVQTNILHSQSKATDLISIFLNKAALFSAAIFGGLQTAKNKDSFGTVGYVADLLVSLFAGSENFYLWKGYGSSFDHSPAILMDVVHNSKVKEKYDNAKNPFFPLNSFADSAVKSWDVGKIIVGDVFESLLDKKNGSILKRIHKTFIGETQEEKNRTAERNLLLSSIGTLSGTIIGTLLPFERMGATIRDVFGVYADLAVYDKADSENAEGKNTGAGNKYFGVSGIFYTLGSVLDLIFRWTRMTNLNLLALGLDRIGNWCYVAGIRKDAKQINNS